MTPAPAHDLPDPATVVTDAVVVFEDVWKRYPSGRDPHPILRALARLGGVEVDGGALTADLEDEDEEEEEADHLVGRAATEGLDVLCGVSLAIERGSCVGIVGPPDAGKSILLRLIAGMTMPSAGRVVVRGTVAPALVSMVRLVPSRFGIRKSVLALAMMARLPRRRVARRLGEVFAFAGVPHPGRDRLVQFSSEQMQRVLVGMMLSVDADIVLVDVRLRDERIRTKVFERIRERTRAGDTVLIAAGTARELADLPDRIIHLDGGRVVWDAPHPVAYQAESEPAATSGVVPRATEEQVAAAGVVPPTTDEDLRSVPPRDVPLSPDAQRLYEFMRVLIGEERAELARRRALVRAPLDAVRVEWTAIAKYAGFDRTEHLGVVDRLRELHGVTDEEPIFGWEELSREARSARDERRRRSDGG